MPLISTWRWLLTALVTGTILASTGGNSVSSEPIRVEVWIGGDDGLTLRLRDALEFAFRSSVDFTLSSGKKPGTLVVTIPANVDWKKIGRRTQVLYSAHFTSVDGKAAGNRSGSCWADALDKCADHIVGDAKNAARKLQ
ncbi:hypothetical protein [uncultured Paludibaculum sp.]|uniref:hypothetical protein n=1 Tax=uncultured Paludibaculum sp. TaxID=1765020 RepID=UPI002AAA6686|nr:hypothetical protein [uncultured Paludibaculum sp.]